MLPEPVLQLMLLNMAAVVCDYLQDDARNQHDF
jgi:hypothetical protein